MTVFRLLLMAMLAIISVYTVITVSNDGWNLFPAFFGDIAKLGWPGQFNVDFSIFLMLSAVWLAWRHDFSASGLFFGLCGILLGTLFLTAYLLVASLKAKGDAKTLLLGETRSLG